VGGDGAAHGAAELGEEAARGAAEGVVAARGAAGEVEAARGAAKGVEAARGAAGDVGAARGAAGAGTAGGVGGTSLGRVATMRDCMLLTVVPAGSKCGDGGKGTTTGLVNSSKKSKSAREGEGDVSAKGKEVSSKITWREMMIRLV